MTKTIKEIERIESELITLVCEDTRRWQKIAVDMIRVDTEKLWEQTSCTSFSAWVRGLAVRARVHESNFWRALKAGRFYTKVRESRPDMAELGEMESKASPESLELVEKISRAAPQEKIQELTEKVLSGELSRKNLRETWRDYRPAMKGKTARGRTSEDAGPCMPDLDSDKVTAGTILTAIREGAQAGLLSDTPPIIVRECTEVAIRPGTTRHARRIDQVIVLQIDEESSLEFVGIEIKVSLSDLKRDMKTLEYADFCDSLYISVPDTLAETAVNLFPPFVGILALMGGEMTVYRQPDLAEHKRVQKADLTGETAKEVLKKII